MIHIAIVEDDHSYVETIRAYLERYEEASRSKIRISVYSDGEDIIQQYDQVFDIILMDVEMAMIDGMTAAHEIRRIDDEVVIIFITNMPQYAMEGYKVDALDYVLKPVSYFALSQRIDRAVKRLNRRTRHYITIASSAGFRKFDVSRIRYVEVQNHECTIHTLDREFKTKDSLRNMEALLEGRSFFRCHKWFLVNLEHVDTITNNDVRVGDSVIQVSRARRKEFLDALNNYLNEG